MSMCKEIFQDSFGNIRSRFLFPFFFSRFSHQVMIDGITVPAKWRKDLTQITPEERLPWTEHSNQRKCPFEIKLVISAKSKFVLVCQWRSKQMFFTTLSTYLPPPLMFNLKLCV